MGNRNVFIQDGTGAWNGIKAVLPTSDPSLSIGDQVEVAGTVTENAGMTEIDPVNRITVIGSETAPEPEVLTTLDMAQEQWEGVLVRAVNVIVTNVNPDDPEDFGEWEISDGFSPIRVDDLYFSYDPIPDAALAYVQGVVNYSSDRFKIEPRSWMDIDGAPTPPVIPTTTPAGIGALTILVSVLITLLSVRKR